MTKRPAVMLDNILVNRGTPVAAPEKPESFRTSIYFSRAVHDVLRQIAFEERKNISDLINEGLDHVLTTRNYETTAELRGKHGR